MLPIDDSAFPPFNHITFGNLNIDTAYRTLNGQYRLKISNTTSFDFTQNQVVSQSTADTVEAVTAKLVITAPLV